MPKFIGNTIEGAERIEDNAYATRGYIRLKYCQARLIPADKIRCSLDTTDRGSKGSYAKRWFRWFALALDVERCEDSTPLMRKRAAKEMSRIGYSDGECA